MKNANEVNEVLLWVDVETTGLDPHKDSLLQVAAIITDLEGKELSQDYFNAIVKHSNPEEVRNSAIPFVQEMHDSTGLWDLLKDGQPLDEIDSSLLDFLKTYAPDPRQARLAGSSCRLDLNFLEIFLPRTYAHLHYRSVDVSALAYTLESWGFAEGYYEKKKTHNALDDIRESLGEYRWLKEQLLKWGGSTTRNPSLKAMVMEEADAKEVMAEALEYPTEKDPSLFFEMTYGTLPPSDPKEAEEVMGAYPWPHTIATGDHTVVTLAQELATAFKKSRNGESIV